MPHRQLFSSKRGFTLVEVLVVIGVFALVFGAINGLLYYSYTAKGFSLGKAIAIDSAYRGVKQLGKELREAIQADDGSYLLSGCADFEIIFYNDMDQDDQVEKIRYFLEPTEEKLKKEIIEPIGQPPLYPAAGETKTVSSFVKNTSTPVFYCYDRAYAGQAEETAMATPVPHDTLNDVGMIGFLLLIDVEPERAPKILEIRSKAQLRNTKQNP